MRVTRFDPRSDLIIVKARVWGPRGKMPVSLAVDTGSAHNPRTISGEERGVMRGSAASAPFAARPAMLEHVSPADREALSAPPTRFDLAAHLNCWFTWTRVSNCFWPRQAGFGTSRQADSELAPMVRAGGIYLIARNRPRLVHPRARSVVYVGETSSFKRRMREFGGSAGLMSDGVRTPGHSAAGRVALQRDQVWVAFFPVEWPRTQRHLGAGFRLWLEAVALEEHRIAHGALPIVNAGEQARESAADEAAK